MQTTSSWHGIEFGISSFAFTWAIGVPGSIPAHPMTVWDLLEQARHLKAQRLQLADNMPVHQLPQEEWSALCRAAESSHIQLELGMRGLIPALLLQYLQLAQNCGSPFVRVVIDSAGFSPDHDQIIAIIREVLPHFKLAGMILAIENHDRFRACELVDMIKATDTQQIGICLDTANSLGADEGIYEVATLLAPYTVNLHVKDYRIRRLSHQMGFSVEGTPAGQGQTPVPWLLQLLSTYRRCQSATLELWSAPLEDLRATIERERQWTEQGAEYLRRLLL